MGQVLGCSTCEEQLDTARDLGLPKSFRVLKVVRGEMQDATYLIKRKLPEGGSEVFAAKALLRSDSVDKEGLLKGIRNHCRLNHIHIVRLLGLILTRTHLLIKLEAWGGGELYDYLQRQRPVSKVQLLSEEHARFFFLQLVYAVHHCHERRVAHRDMKFANIVLDGRKTPILKVCEFGLSKGWDSGEDCKSFTTVGTPLYMSPEVLKIHVGHIHEPYDPRESDVWSLGVILFTMLLGRFPYLSSQSEGGVSKNDLSRGSSVDFKGFMETIEKAYKSQPKQLKSEIWSCPDLSDDCKNLLESMLQLDATKRITLSQIIHHKWVCGPLLLEHAHCIANCREEMEYPYYDPISLDLGSSHDEDLVGMIEECAKLGDNDCDCPLTFWSANENASLMRNPNQVDRSEPSFSVLYRNYRSCLNAS